MNSPKPNPPAITDQDHNNDLFKILKAAFDSSYDGLCLCDAAGNVICANNNAKGSGNDKIPTEYSGLLIRCSIIT